MRTATKLLAALAMVAMAPVGYAAIGGGVVPVSTSPGGPGNTLSAVPFTGFNSYYAQIITPTQTYMQDVSDFLVSSGLQTAWGGVVVAGIDEGWETLSGSTVVRSGGNPVFHATNFPTVSTMLSHIKANGQILGIYRDGGQTGCIGEDWGAGTLSSDISYFMSTLGFQLIKLDGCNIAGVTFSGRTIYGAGETTMAAQGVPYLLTYGYSNGPYTGFTQSWAYGPRTGAAWRYTQDVGNQGPACSTAFDSGPHNVMTEFWAGVHHPGVVGPYHFADADYLLAQDGSGSLSTNEAVTQMVLAALASSPWVLGCDPRNLGTTELATLKNADLISILKDPWVYGARRLDGQNGGGGYGTANTWEYFCKRLQGTGKRAIAIVNENTGAVGAQTVTVNAAKCGIDTAQTYTWKNVLTGATTAGQTGTFLSGSLPSHATGLFLITAATENNDNCWATNPGGTGQSASGYSGSCAFTSDNNGNPSGGYPQDGTTVSTATAINTSGLTNPAPQGCYQKQRKGVISTDDPNEAAIEYLADNLVAGATYHYRLHMAEIEGNTTGQRLFNLTINTGVQQVAALSSHDIFASAGGANKAEIVEGNIVADHGYLSFDYEPLATPTGVPTTGCIEVIKQ